MTSNFQETAMSRLYAYQRQAFDFCMRRLYTEDELGAGLFLDPGLGKTLITLTLLQQLRDLGEIENALIIAPLRVCKLVWPLEINKWGFDFSVNMLCERAKRGLRQFPANVELINPESLHHLTQSCSRWDMLVVDESTKFKNWTAKRTKALRKMLPNFEKRLILTGTPAPNSLADLHSQAFILDNGAALGRNVTVFRSLYCHQGGWQGKKWLLDDQSKQPIQDAVAPMCLRLDAESCLDMPELVVNDMYCELPPACKRQYRILKKELLAQLETGNILAQNAASAYMKMRQFANGMMYDEDRNPHLVHREKMNMLLDLIDELSGKPLLLFYQFGHDMSSILESIKKVDKQMHKHCKTLNGQTKSKEAEQSLASWNKKEIPIFLVQVQAASHGLNMQKGGNDIAYYGLSDSLEVYDQSFRRIYRNGVEGQHVRVHRLLTSGTVDDIILQRQEQKDETQQAFLRRLKAHAMEG